MLWQFTNADSYKTEAIVVEGMTSLLGSHWTAIVHFQYIIDPQNM